MQNNTALSVNLEMLLTCFYLHISIRDFLVIVHQLHPHVWHPQFSNYVSKYSVKLNIIIEKSFKICVHNTVSNICQSKTHDELVQEVSIQFYATETKQNGQGSEEKLFFLKYIHKNSEELEYQDQNALYFDIVPSKAVAVKTTISW